MITNAQDLIAFLREQGPRWIQSQRALHRPNGRRLAKAESEVLTPFFGHETITRVRLVTIGRIPNPNFYAILAKEGIPTPLDFTQMSGITLYDTVLVSEARAVTAAEWLPFLFHELVHVVQYELLGVDEFIGRYATGWAQNGFLYESIPLERDAYELDGRFRLSPNVLFSPQAEVKRQLGVP